MTTKEAAERFHITEREVQKLCKDGKIAGVSKHGRGYYIPDNTPIIVTDSDVCAFVRLLLQYKNNPQMIVPIAGLDTAEKRRVWHEYLVGKGLVGECQPSDSVKSMLNGMQLTDEGLKMAFKNNNKSFLLNVPLNLNINVACMNVG